MQILKSKYLDYLIILIVLFIGVWQLVCFQATMKWDAVDITLPWKFYITEGLNNGELPLWNPFVRNGFSQMGESSNWYPVSWFFGFFHRYDITGLHFEYIFHLYFAGIGFYKLCNLFSFSRPIKVLLAICYMLSGFFIGNAQHLGWIISATWLVYVFYYFVQLYKIPNVQNSIKLGFFFFLMLSGGYPGIFIITGYSLLALFIAEMVRLITTKKYGHIKKWMTYLVGTSVLFLLMSSVVLIASFDLAKHITRGFSLSQSHQLDILKGPLPLKGLLSFVFPYGASINNLTFWKEDFSLVNVYIGIIPLMFMFIGLTFKNPLLKKSVIFLLIGGVFLLLAMAKFFPFREWLTFLPFMDLFRFATIFRIFTIICFLIVAGFGLESILNGLMTKNQLVIRSFLALIILVVTPLIFMGVNFYKTNPLPTVTQFLNSESNLSGIHIRMFWSGILSALFILGVIISFLLLERKKAIYLVCLLGLLDVMGSFRLNASATLYQEYNVKKINSRLNEIPTGNPKPSLYKNVSELHDKHFQKEIPFLWRNLGMLLKSHSSGGYGPYKYNSEESAKNKGYYSEIIKNPLLFLAKKVSNGIVDSKSILVNSAEKIEIKEYNQNSISAQIEINEKVNLIFLQNIYPDWNVYLNGEEKMVLLINETFMGVELDRGLNLVEFRFEPTKVIYTFYLSSIVFVLALCLLAFFFWKDHRAEWRSLILFWGVILFFFILYFSLSSYGINNTSKVMNIRSQLSKNDFEKEVKFWSSSLIDKSTYYEGERSSKLDSKNLYSSTFKSIFKDLGQKLRNVYINVHIKRKQPSTPQLIFQVQRNGENIYWKNKPIKTELNFKSNTWESVDFKIDLDELDIFPDDEIAIYIWNENKKDIWIDNFIIEVE